jgi:putative endonuclease
MWTGNRREAGSAGEEAALQYLKSQGLELVLRNYRCRQGEIDLVMLDGNTLALIEVRYRRAAEFGGAAASVDFRKQRRLVTAARYLLATRADLRRYPARFDVVALSAMPPHVEWIKHAFIAES